MKKINYELLKGMSPDDIKLVELIRSFKVLSVGTQIACNIVNKYHSDIFKLAKNNDVEAFKKIEGINKCASFLIFKIKEFLNNNDKELIKMIYIKFEVKLTQPFSQDKPTGIINFTYYKGNKTSKKIENISCDKNYTEMSFNLYLTVKALSMILDNDGKDCNIYISNPISYVSRVLYNVEDWEDKNFMSGRNREYKNIDLLFELFRIKRNLENIYILNKLPYFDLSHSN